MRRQAAVALALLLLLPACVSVGRGREMEARISRLEGDALLASQQLDQQRAVLRERIAEADRKIREVQAKIDELNHVAHKAGADVAVDVQRLNDDVVRLRGTLEEQQHRAEEIDKGLAQLRQDTDGRFAALKGAGALEAFEAKRKLGELKLPAEKGPFLALAQEQEAKGERGVARQLYDEYVKRWPTDPRAADAHFRLGEIAYGEQRWREAILAYGKVAQDFPRSDKAPDAMLRTAEAMVQLDLRDDARALFAEVEKRYPKTTAAAKAKARLAQLAGSKKKPGNGKRQ
jgi:tol-pal system protein YbgF